MCASGRLFSARASRDDELRPRPEPRQQPAEVGGGDRDAALGRRVARPGDMQEDRAAAPGAARPVVPADLHDEIVQAVVAQHAFGRSPIGQQHGPVVVRIAGRVAPAVPRFRQTHRQPRRSCARPGAAPPQAPQRVDAGRSDAVALAFAMSDAAPAEGAAKCSAAAVHPSPGGARIEGFNRNAPCDPALLG